MSEGKTESEMVSDFEETANKFMKCLQEMGFKKISKFGEHGELVNNYGNTVYIDYGDCDCMPDERRITISGKYFDALENKVRDVSLILYFDTIPDLKKYNEERHKKIITQPPEGTTRVYSGDYIAECKHCGCIDYVKIKNGWVCFECGTISEP